MNNEQILNSIVNVLNDPNFNQAILIDGEWGSGKTYFIKNKLTKSLEEMKFDIETSESYKVGYFSLYGKSDINELKSEILMFIQLSKRINKSIDEDTSKMFYNLASLIFNAKNMSISHTQELLQPSNASNFILIFDDLERCTLPMNQILGFINSFSEHMLTKVIVVSNQKEVGLIIDGTDLPSKYSVVLNSNLIIDNNNEGKKKAGKSDISNTFSIEDIERRTKDVFSRNNEYERVKEKLIGLTVKFVPDLYEIYDSLIENLKYKSYLEDNKNAIIDYFAVSKYNNIRTMSFCLTSITEILSKLKPKYLEDKLATEIVKNIAEYSAYLSIRLKQGKPNTFMWEGNTTFAKTKLINTNDSVYSNNKYIYVFKFVDDFVQFRSISEMDMDQTLDQFLEMRHGSIKRESELMNLSLHTLNNMLDFEDDEIVTLLEKLKGELINNKYQVEEFQKIISLVSYIKDLGFDVKIEEYTDLMIQNIHEINIDSSSRFGLWHELDSQSDKNAKYYKLINEAIKRNKMSNLINGLDSCLKEINWSDTLEVFVYKHKDDFFFQKTFLSLFESPKTLTSLIINSDTKQIRSFHRATESVYSFSNIQDYYTQDIDFITELMFELEKIDKEKFGITKKAALSYLMITLRTIISILSRKK